MSESAPTSRTVKSPRKPLGVWELPQLLQSVHRRRKTVKKPVRDRPHFRAILAFVHRNRFAVASQIQRRFAESLPSDRTARRHLAEMEALGDLRTVDTTGVSPLWPKVYFVTRRGLTKLREALRDAGQEWSESHQDRHRAEGTAAQHVLHELFLTEFLLMAWESTQARDDLQMLTMQRRSLARHNAFAVVMAGRKTRLQPDGMLLVRQEGRGMMCHFLEIDRDTMSAAQMIAKFRRYQVWAESAAAKDYLKHLYQRHGATAPTANFRILIVVGSQNSLAEQRRLALLFDLASQLPAVLRDRIWFSTVTDVQMCAEQNGVLTNPLWLRCRDVPATWTQGNRSVLTQATRHAVFRDTGEITA